MRDVDDVSEASATRASDTSTSIGTSTTTGTSTGTTAGDGAARNWLLHRRFVLRVAGLPVEAVERLRDPRARAWAEQVLDAQDRIDALADALADPLTALVVATDDERQRRRVLALRREVFNGRVPRDPDAVRELARAAGGGTGELLERWLTARRELAGALATGGGLVDDGLAAARAELRRLAAEERLRLGLVLASPTLDGQLDAFIAEGAAGPVPAPDKRARKKERSLLSYLYRTACKTSPFSTFTAVAAGSSRSRPAKRTKGRRTRGASWATAGAAIPG